MSGREDSNLRPPEPHSDSSLTDPQADQAVTASPPGACTTACTNIPENVKLNTIDALADELLRLPKEDRAKLAAILLQQGDDGPKGG